MIKKALTLRDLEKDLRAFNCMDRIPEIKVGKYSYSDIRFNTIDSDVVVFYSEALNKNVENLEQQVEQFAKDLEKLEDKLVLLLEENTRYFKLITLLKKEKKELETQEILEVKE